MLCLQNGRFDHPDRMFNRVHDAFNNCLNNMSDFKELIPEFYDTSENGGDFLMNNFKINFGDKHDGVPVNHVILPPWADSPETFINILRCVQVICFKVASELNLFAFQASSRIRLCFKKS